jgi:hypothetical protein
MTLPPGNLVRRAEQVVSDRGVIVATRQRGAARGLAAGSECRCPLTVTMVAATACVGDRRRRDSSASTRSRQRGQAAPDDRGSMGVALENARLFDETQRC